MRQEELKEIFAERFTVADKVDQILVMVERGEHKVTLHQLFEGMTSRREMICTFLAILELMKMKHIRTVQEQEHGDVLIIAADPDEAPAAPADDALVLESAPAGDADAAQPRPPPESPSHE